MIHNLKDTKQFPKYHLWFGTFREYKNERMQLFSNIEIKIGDLIEVDYQLFEVESFPFSDLNDSMNLKTYTDRDGNIVPNVGAILEEYHEVDSKGKHRIGGIANVDKYTRFYKLTLIKV